MAPQNGSDIYRLLLRYAPGVMPAATAQDAASRVAQLVAQGISRKDAVKQTAQELDLPKNAVYDAALSGE